MKKITEEEIIKCYGICQQIPIHRVKHRAIRQLVYEYDKYLPLFISEKVKGILKPETLQKCCRERTGIQNEVAFHHKISVKEIEEPGNVGLIFKNKGYLLLEEEHKDIHNGKLNLEDIIVEKIPLK
jgi:hypothetical protein